MRHRRKARVAKNPDRMRFACLNDWLVWQQSFHPRSIDLGLERVRRVFETLRPDYRPPVTITVGGTNGKGSCVAMLEAILKAQGVSVGAYTSPHILDYNERIRIDGLPVSDQAIVDVFARIDEARGDISLSFFEFATLAALELFALAEVRVQLLEVGLGGRLDAVNIVDADVAVITSIDIDHKDWLGETRERIGVEKAGIFRSGRPAVIGDRRPPLSLLQQADQRQAPLQRLGFDFDHSRRDRDWDWSGPDHAWKRLPLPALPGSQQLDNAAMVMAALRALGDRLPVTQDAIVQGLEAVRLPGRYQLLPGPPQVLLDVAHNPQAAGLLAEYLRNQYPGRRIVALFTAMCDKDIEGILDVMRQAVDAWVLLELPGNPRAASGGRLVEAFRKVGLPFPLASFQDCSEAIACLEQQAGPEGLIVVFGSFFLVAEFFRSSTNAKVLGGKQWIFA